MGIVDARVKLLPSAAGRGGEHAQGQGLSRGHVRGWGQRLRRASGSACRRCPERSRGLHLLFCQPACCIRGMSLSVAVQCNRKRICSALGLPCLACKELCPLRQEMRPGSCTAAAG